MVNFTPKTNAGPLFNLPWWFYLILSAMMKIPAVFMTVSGFIVVEGEGLKWLMGMLGFAVSLMSWAAEKDVVMFWYGPRGGKNPVVVHLIAFVFFFLCVSANSLNQFITHRDALAGEATAKQTADAYRKNRDTLSLSKEQLTSQISARLPGLTEKLRLENRRVRQAIVAGQPFSTDTRDTLAGEVRGMQDAAEIVSKVEPLPLTATANFDGVLSQQFDQLRIARAKLPMEMQKLIDAPRPAEKQEISTRPVRLWQDATMANTPDARLSWFVGVLVEALAFLTWLAAVKGIPIPSRIQQLRAWFRDMRDALAPWRTCELEYFVEPIGFSGSWRVEVTQATFTLSDLSSEPVKLCDAISRRLGRTAKITQLKNDDGTPIHPDVPLMIQLGKGPLVIEIALMEDSAPSFQKEEYRK